LFGKLFELIVKPQLDRFVLVNRRLPQKQSGFRAGYSTDSAVLKISSDIYERLGKSEVVFMLSLDFSKAFDTVCHDILLEKLKYHGVRETSLWWFKSYLEGRTQQVNVGGNYSSVFAVVSGVPQGSILSPLLYILYTADMHTCLNYTSYYCYADDTQLIHAGKPSDLFRIKQEIEHDFDQVALWAASNLLKLNANKTVFTVFRGRQVTIPPVHLNLDGQDISASPSIKVLGVIFDESMSFADHADFIAKKVTGFLQMLALRRNKLPRSTLTLLVNAYVSSRLSYCLAALSSSSVIRAKFQLLQNYAVRTIFGLSKFSHVSYLRKHLQWLTIEELGDIKLGVFAFKAIYGKTPDYLPLNLSDFLPSHEHYTRSTNLRLPVARNSYSDKTFEARSVALYNKHPKDIWAESLSVFTEKLTTAVYQ
jgi:hypothetical protein